MSCHLYVDEVGSGELKGADTIPDLRYLSLTGILTTDVLYRKSIVPEVERIKSDFFNSSPEKPVILHRREIMRREGVFSVLRDKEKDEAFRFRLLSLIGSMPYRAVTVAIDKLEHLDRYHTWRFDPYHYCLQCLVERYVRWLDRNNLTGDVIIESRYPKVDKKLKASFRRTYQNGTNYVNKDIIQQRLTSREIKIFSKKANCAGLQLSDIIAHPSLRAMRRLREQLQPLNDIGYEIVSILEEKKYLRNPRSLQIDGWGRKWLP